MQKSLRLTNEQYSLCVSMFCTPQHLCTRNSWLTATVVGYIIFMFPANIILKIVAPNIVVGAAAITFGALVCGLGGAANYATLIALRLLIGCSQSFIQGMTIVSTAGNDFTRSQASIALLNLQVRNSVPADICAVHVLLVPPR
jgi:hypothetical protein